MENRRYGVDEIAELLGGRLEGNGGAEVWRMDFVCEAQAGSLTFVGSGEQAGAWGESDADAVIAPADAELPLREGKAVIRAENVEKAVSAAAELFRPPPPRIPVGVHPTAFVDESAELGEGVSVGAGAYVGPGVVVGANSVIYPNATVLDDSRIGEGTVLHAGGCVGERTLIGDRCEVRANACLGADGFGFVMGAGEDGGHKKIPHIGRVEIGNGVVVGSGTCVDRGKFGSTRVGDGTKIGDQVHVAHNSVIGKHNLICSGAGVAGSSVLGDFCFLGGKAGIADHLRVGANANIRPFSMVISNVPENADFSGQPAEDHRVAQKKLEFLENAVAGKNPTR